VFISYSSRDVDFILGEVKPLLQAAACFKIILDLDEFRWGEDPAKNMEDAVRNSAFTIAIITQAYVDGDWSMFEAMEASILSRLIPIVFQMPTKVPTKLRERHSYGLALDPSDWDAAFERLLTYIGVPASEAKQTLLRRGPRNRPSLRCRVRHLNTQKRINEFEDVLRTARPSYQRLMSCKALHDAFQRAQLSYRQLSDAKRELLGTLGAATESTALGRLWKSLKIRATALNADLVEVRREAEPLREQPDAWEVDLIEAAEDLRKGIEDREIDAVKSALERIRGRIWTEPTYLNRIIVDERKRLALSELSQPLAEVARLLRAVRFEPEVSGVVDPFLEACAAFEAAGRRLSRLIDNHNILQGLDDGFAQLDESPAPSASAIQRLWNRAKDSVGRLGAQDLQAEVSSLTDAASALQGAFASNAAYEILRENYNDFRFAITQVFHATDNELKRASGHLVNQLQRVEETLEKLQQ
jgi:hypothetical protein